MKTNKSCHLCSLLQRMFFKDVGGKFRPGSFKKTIDLGFRIYEKTAGCFNFLSLQYSSIYDGTIDKEISIAEISSDDRILVIGCGSLPATVYLLHKKTGACIVGIDTDIKAVNKAKKYLKQLNVDNYCTIINTNGSEFPVNNFDVIFIAYGVRKQQDIIQHLSEKISSSTKIIFRIPTESEDTIKNEDIDITKYFIIKDRVESVTLGSVTSLLLQKKKNL